MPLSHNTLTMEFRDVTKLYVLSLENEATVVVGARLQVSRDPRVTRSGFLK